MLVKRVDVTLTCSSYLNIFAGQVHTFMATIVPDVSGVCQQDNVHCHSAKIVQVWFEEYGKEFRMLLWPPNYPDLNPIGHQWDVLVQLFALLRLTGIWLLSVCYHADCRHALLFCVPCNPGYYKRL